MITKDKIKEILLKSEDVVVDSGLSEGFKGVAFGEVFRILIDSESQLKVQPPVDVTEKISKSVKNIAKGSSRSLISPAKLVDELITNGFFKENRSLTDCIKVLNVSKGVKVPSKQMATILVRKLRSGRLNRNKSESGYTYSV